MIRRSFINNGLYNLDSDGSYPEGNQGLFEMTNDPADKGKFKPPSLRNIAKTAPYMHDGSIATLEEVVRHYERGGRLVPEGTMINGQDVSGDGRDNPNKSTFLNGFEITDQEKRRRARVSPCADRRRVPQQPGAQRPVRGIANAAM